MKPSLIQSQIDIFNTADFLLKGIWIIGIVGSILWHIVNPMLILSGGKTLGAISTRVYTTTKLDEDPNKRVIRNITKIDDISSVAVVGSTYKTFIRFNIQSFYELLNFHVLAGNFLGLLKSILLLYIIHLGRIIIRCCKGNSKFQPGNVSRARLLGWLMIIYPFLSFLRKLIIDHYIISLANLEHYNLHIGSWEIHWHWLASGFIMLVLAEIVQKGCIVQMENDLTI